MDCFANVPNSEAFSHSQVLEISVVYEVYDELDSPELEYPPIKTSIGSTSQQSGSVGSYCSSASEGKASSVSIGPNSVTLTVPQRARVWEDLEGTP